MRRHKRYIASFAAFITGAVLLLSVTADFAGINPEGKINYINRHGGISSGDALTYQKAQLKAEEPDGYSVTFYEIAGEESIYTPVTGREEFAPVIILCGRIDDGVSGSLLIDYEDDNRCVLGYETAAKLFGSTDVKGLEVICNGKDYIVTGVSKKTENIFVAGGGIAEDVTYTRMKVDYSNPQARNMVRQEVESRFDTGNYIENEFIYWIVGIVFSVSVAFFIFSIAAAMSRRAGIKKRYVMLAAAVVCIALAFIVIDYPSDMIPSRWSDTSFWREIIKVKTDNIRAFIYAEKTEAALSYMMNVGSAFLKCLAAIFFSIIGIMVYMLKEKERDKDGGIEMRQGQQDL